MKNPNLITLLLISAISAAFANTASAGSTKTATELGLKNDGTTDNTDALANALKAGASDIYFEDGTYLLGTVHLPADTHLRFSPRAKLRVQVSRVEQVRQFLSPKPEWDLLIVDGDNVSIDGLSVDFTLPQGAKDELIDNDAVSAFIYGRGIHHLTVTNCVIGHPERRELIPLADRRRGGRYKGPTGFTLVNVEDCEDVTLSNSQATSISRMVNALMCRNVSVHGNRMITGAAMTTFSVGGQGLRHFDNWSRDVNYQVVWRGGSPDPSRKAPEVPLGSSTVVKRGSRPGDADYNRNTAGVYDVIVQNNYAEYGNTLAWGNKCRQVVIANNIARYISDYAFGVEGGENVLFSGNISINSTSGAFVSMYWGEKIQITGNSAIIRNDGWDPEYSWWPTEKQYQGPFARLHHGPETKQDHDAGSLYGAGSVAITGNLFVNEITGLPKTLVIQSGRDVTVSGNKFVNGLVSKMGKGSLTVTNNEFTWKFAQAFPCVQTKNIDGNVMITNNVMRREPQTKEIASSADVADTGPGLAATDKESDDQPITDTQAAINITWITPLRLIATGNVIDGWSQSVAAASTSKTPATIVLSDNTMSGKINISGDWKQCLRNNIDLQSLDAGNQVSQAK